MGAYDNPAIIRDRSAEIYGQAAASFGAAVGKGIMNYSHGGKYVGEFYGGDPWNAVEYNKDGNIIGKWMNGVRQ